MKTFFGPVLSKIPEPGIPYSLFINSWNYYLPYCKRGNKMADNDLQVVSQFSPGSILPVKE